MALGKELRTFRHDPLETHGVEELSLEATKEHSVKMGKWRLHQPSKSNFFVLEIVRICQKATEPLTNFIVWQYKGTAVRYIDGDERQPSRLAILIWTEADEVATELQELTTSQVWVDELAFTDSIISSRTSSWQKSSEALHGAS